MPTTYCTAISILHPADNMEKGLEITFTVPGKNGATIVQALANLVGNEFLKEFDIQWRIFDVRLDRERFYKVCFIGHKLSKLHPLNEEKVKKRFDELAHTDMKVLMRIYDEQKRQSGFKKQVIQEKKEEYDLWEDNFWKYF